MPYSVSNRSLGLKPTVPRRMSAANRGMSPSSIPVFSAAREMASIRSLYTGPVKLFTMPLPQKSVLRCSNFPSKPYFTYFTMSSAASAAGCCHSWPKTTPLL